MENKKVLLIIATILLLPASEDSEIMKTRERIVLLFEMRY